MQLSVQPTSRPRRERFGTGQSLLVFDDFLLKPERVRSFALALEDRYTTPGRLYYPGMRARAELPLDGVSASIGRHVNWDLGACDVEAHFSVITLRDTQLVRSQRVPHVDSVCDNTLVGLLYLNLPEDCRGGTGFFRHRPTRIEHVAGGRLPEDISQQFIDSRRTGYIRGTTKYWELIHVVDMRFNRLVVYNGSVFHSPIVADDDFGSTFRSRRLTLNITFTSRSVGAALRLSAV